MATATKRRKKGAEDPIDGSWRCMVCAGDNPFEAEACGSCETPRGEPVKPKKAARNRMRDHLNGAARHLGMPATQEEAEAKEKAAGNGHVASTVETLDVDAKLIDWRKDNPRQDVDNNTLEQLAGSIQAHGLQNPIVLRRKGKRFEGWQGNRRFLAMTRRLKLATVTARVYPETTPDEQMIRARADENLERLDLNPIERAESLRQKLESYGWDPNKPEGPSLRSLAPQIGMSQGDISNHLRMLELPADWRSRLIAGEITATQARALCPWTGRPEVLQRVAKTVKMRSQGRGGMTTVDFDAAVESVAQQLSLPCERGAYYSFETGRQYHRGEVLFTASDLERFGPDLDIVTVNGKPRAFNTKRWFELHGNVEKAHREKEDARAARKASGAPGKPARSAADQKRLGEQQKKQLQTKIWRYKVRWLQARAAAAVLKSEGYVGIKLLIAFAGTDDREGRRGGALADIIRANGGNVKNRDYAGLDVWGSVASLPTDKKITEVARQVLAAWLQLDAFTDWRAPIRPHEVLIAAAELGIDFEREWRCDQEFLELFSKDQLADLAGEWGLLKLPGWKDLRGGSGKRSETIEQMLRYDTATKQFPAPKVLIKAKA